MTGANRDLLLGLGHVMVITVIPVLAFALLLHGTDVARGLLRTGRRLRLLPRPLPVTYAPPVECVAASMRRVAGALRHPEDGMTQVRRRGLQMAYDDLLATACWQLGLPQSLAQRTGWDREIERLRVEASLEAAGLRIRPDDT